MTEGVRIRDIENEKTRRRAARQMIGDYHEQQLRLLLDHVRDGFAQMDAGEIDPFDLDELIHHYKRSARELWSFCGSSGGAWERAALMLEWEREQGDPRRTGGSSAVRRAGTADAATVDRPTRHHAAPCRQFVASSGS
jgi:hypothetical protein